MDAVTQLLQMFLTFLLQFVTLLVGFVISALTLFLDFFRSLVGIAS